MIDGTATLRGLTIGVGTVYELREWPGDVLSTATIRVEDNVRPRRRGVVPADDFMGGLTVAFEVQINAGSRAASEAAATVLLAAFQPAPADEFLDVRISGDPTEYSLRGRPRGCQVAIDRRRFIGGLIDARCTFVATDPVRYGPEQSVNIGLVDPGAGLEFPVTFPVTFSGGGVGSGTALVNNAGTAPVDWMATLTGPLTNPRLTLVGSGKFVKVLATIVSGETVVLDSAAGAILLGGTAPRPQWFGPGSSWWQLAPGNNSVQLTVDAGSGSALFTWRSGWG